MYLLKKPVADFVLFEIIFCRMEFQILEKLKCSAIKFINLILTISTHFVHDTFFILFIPNSLLQSILTLLWNSIFFFSNFYCAFIIALLRERAFGNIPFHFMYLSNLSVLVICGWVCKYWNSFTIKFHFISNFLFNFDCLIV